MAIGHWAEEYLNGGQANGGSGGGGDLFIVTGTPQDQTSGTTDRAYAELEAASAAGKVIVLNIMGTSAILSSQGINYVGYFPMNTSESSMDLTRVAVGRGVNGEADMSFSQVSLG